jgi:transcriptional regulator with XRE-family HTH domain
VELSDEELVREAMARVAHIDNQTEKARRLGISESTVRRWLAGEVALPLRKGTREPLERFVTYSDELGADLEAGSEPRTPAEELLHYLGVRAGLRRVARELTDKDLIAVAYTIARKDSWPLEELRKLDAWRDDILGGSRPEPE